MGISRYNSEGYSDPTSHAALSGIQKEEKAAKRAYRPLVYICSPFAGGQVREHAEGEAVQQVCGGERRDTARPAPFVSAVPG